jgi:hypothetical protein
MWIHMASFLAGEPGHVHGYYHVRVEHRSDFGWRQVAVGAHRVYYYDDSERWIHLLTSLTIAVSLSESN